MFILKIRFLFVALIILIFVVACGSSPATYDIVPETEETFSPPEDKYPQTTTLHDNVYRFDDVEKGVTYWVSWWKRGLGGIDCIPFAELEGERIE